MEAVPAYDGPTALRMDVNLGDPNGLDVLKALRRQSGQIPVVMLTALDGEMDKVQGLELGADDYLAKPFSVRELIARIRAQLRRNTQQWRPLPPKQTVLRVGSIRLDPADHSVTLSGKPVSLTVTEFRLLHCLMANAGRVVPTSELLKQVWGYQDPSGADVVRVTVFRLRRKLEVDPSRPTVLHTIPGVGVLLKADAEQPSLPIQDPEIADRSARKSSGQVWMGSVDSSGLRPAAPPTQTDSAGGGPGHPPVRTAIGGAYQPGPDEDREAVSRQMRDYYAVLQVQPGADREVIEAAYRRLMKKHHPDLDGDDPQRIAEHLARARALNEAYSVLRDPEQRRRYDVNRGAHRWARTPASPGS
jgi:DNA-binding response OmpR family regulator